ncbi:unnamed protein product [Zymoseptoria tritici ST99CH_3D7]|uniref:GAR domain-containing protein n=2 Tax=Zymoseptoria tritici TaxID=1047171 RepID=A0A1X7RFJ6_ZYMT9|nr:unnamed protein product [Zymoseptoria tritici ST99CH_3D7]SMR42539.1 unnamed protein product [Zymoseptoria tritici ST99CH_1E4]
MPPPTPLDDPPRMPSPTKQRRPASRSPNRRAHRARDVDNLLRDLSPATTLRAFLTTATDTAATPTSINMQPEFHGDPDILARSIDCLSDSERALGVKAAQACLDLRTWLRELQSWEWPGRFDAEEQGRLGTTNGTQELGGSLPDSTVHEYEKRADQISRQVDQINVEELKEYVLQAHYRQGSRAGNTPSVGLKRLDDFTALITATILQALPFLTQLNRLLDVWTVRLIILRSAPSYLQDLHRARAELEKSWAAIATSPSNISVCSRESMLGMKTSLQNQVASLGRRLDRFLDDLEGREETVPDSWVDKFEALETTYGSWVVQAERLVLENEWRIAREQRTRSEIVPVSADVVEPDALTEASDAVQSNGTLDSAPQDLVVVPASPETRSVSVEASVSSALLSDDSGGGIAKRRAAFLNDIERTNSLKLASKSPVRPFEHATNAFTKLFKKDRSPDRPVPRRSTSRNLHVNTIDDSASTRPSSMRSVSAASFRLNNNSSPASSITSDTEHSHPSRAPSHSIQSSTTEQRRDSQQPDHSLNMARVIPETYQPTRLRPRADASGEKEFPENWPLDSAPTLLRNTNTDFNRSQLDVEREPEHDLQTPTAASETDTFDSAFVNSLPSPSAAGTYPVRDVNDLPPNSPNQSPVQPDPAPSSDLESPTLRGSEHPPSLKVEIPTGNGDERAERRASTAYIGTFHRSQLKSIDVGRSSGQTSVSSRNSPSTTGTNSPSSRSAPVVQIGNFNVSAASPMSDDNAFLSPGLPRDDASTMIPETPALYRHSIDRSDASSPLVDSEPDSPLSSASLNAAMFKRRNVGTMQKENLPPSRTRGTATPIKKVASTKFAEDSFDRHVSEVLEALPAPIKFRSRAGAETPVHGGGGSDGRVSIGPRSKIQGLRAPSRTGLMIAPAENAPRKPASASEPEVKLYHLTQAGREDPIKLFVRLVGEGERVMVRVGGGWADLADYLRQYAEHHGSRTVSEGNLEIQTVTSIGSGRRVSGPVDFRAKTPTMVTPVRSRNGGGERYPLTDEATMESPYSRARTPSDATTTEHSSPKSTRGSSRPPTATGSRPSSKQGLNEVGLSGPSSGKRGLPDHKAKWVEGMIERAKASAEKSKDGEFKELGKVGGTRRMIFRSASGTGERPK